MKRNRHGFSVKQCDLRNVYSENDSDHLTIKKKNAEIDSDVVTTIESFPDEVLVSIFKYLSKFDIDNCANTCLRWKRVVVFYFFNQHLCKVAKKYKEFKDAFDKEGWTEECLNEDLIIRIYKETYSGVSLYLTTFYIERYLQKGLRYFLKRRVFILQQGYLWHRIFHPQKSLIFLILLSNGRLQLTLN